MTEQTKALAPIDDLKRTIVRLEPQFKAALPAHITPEKFVRVLLTAVQNTPALVNADRNSLLGACMKAAQAGLLPDGKESAIVMFKDKAQFMPMIAGLLKQVRNSGELASITSQIVHKGDKFRYWVDSNGEHLEHEPNFFGDRGARIGVYALAKTKDGAVYIEVLTAKDVEAIRNVSRSKDSGPWSGPFEGEMWRKSSLRRLSKRLPSSTDLDDMIHKDDELFMPEEPEAETAASAAPQPASRLEGLMGKAKPAAATPAPAPAASNQAPAEEAELVEPKSQPVQASDIPI